MMWLEWDSLRFLEWGTIIIKQIMNSIKSWPLKYLKLKLFEVYFPFYMNLLMTKNYVYDVLLGSHIHYENIA